MKNKLLLITASLLAAAFPIHAQILSNGTGGGVFNVTTTWDGGVIPTNVDSWTVLAGDTVTTAGSPSIRNNTTTTVNGILTMGLDDFNISGIGGGGNFIFNGTVSFDRMFTNGSSENSTGRVSLTGGSVTVANRITLTNTTPTTTSINSFTQSGGDLIGTTASSGFNLYGADADDRAQFNIIGNAGTFNFTTRNVVLFNTAVGFENSATDINFTFGSAAGAGAVTTVQSAGLTLGSNAFTLDFTNITRPGSATTYSTTLFDYSSTLTGSFGTLSSLGLGAGETASLFVDTDNKLIGVEYTLAAIPEPGTLALVGIALGSLLLFRRRR